MPIVHIDKKPIDRWIPWLFVLFFLTFMVVDAVMVTLAVRTQTGVVTEHAYEKGLAYNQALETEAAQKAMGWSDEIALNGKTLSFSLHDAQGQFIEGAVVTAQITRPVQDGHDFTVTLIEIENHIYEVKPTFPMAGEWFIRIHATWQGKHYQSSKTILVP